VRLHGLTDARFFEQNIGPLAERFDDAFATDQRGHGHAADGEGPITFDVMAQDTTAFLEHVVGRLARLGGHSNGAFVALLIALRRPDLVRRLVLVSGGFHRGSVRGGDQFAVDEVVAALGPSYGEVSPDGEEHFRVVLEKTAEMERTEPAFAKSELGKVNARTLVIFGDDDLMTREHVNATYEGIPDSELAIVPGTSYAKPLRGTPAHVDQRAKHRDGGITRRHLAALARCRLSGDFSETLSALAKHAER